MTAASRPWPLLPAGALTVHHVSDTHFGYRPWSYAEGDHMLDDLEQGLISQVSLMVHTGDITDNGAPVEDSYARAWLPAAAGAAPSLWCMGNHDVRVRQPVPSRTAWEAAYNRPANTYIDAQGVRFISFAADSDGPDGWRPSPATWSWLADTIASAPGPVVLADHYPPWELQQWPENTIQPSATFTAIVADHPQVIGMLCGHMHWEIDDVRAARFVQIGGRSIPVLTDISSMLSIDGRTRDQSAQLQSHSAYVSMWPDRWEVRYRAHGTHAWSGPGGLRVTTLDLGSGLVSRGM